MEVSITIVTHNTRKILKDCIDSIKEKTRGIEYEIIITDNGSSDKTVEMLASEYPEVRVTRNEESIGFGGGNNQAFALARGEYVMILEPDTLLKTDNTIKILMDYMKEHPEVGAVAPRLILMKNGKVQRSAFLRFPNLLTFACEWLPVNEIINKLFPRWDHWGKYYYDVSQLTEIKNVPWVMGGILLLRKKVIDEIGGFDQKIFLLAEDTDLCRKIRAAGYEIVFHPGADVMHYWGANQENLTFTLDCYYNGMGYYLRKYHGDLYRRCAFLITALASMFSIVWCSLLKVVWKVRRPQFDGQIIWYKHWLRILRCKVSGKAVQL